MNLTRAYLTSANVGVSYWPDAMAMAIDVLNRTTGPTVDSSDGPTSYELMTGVQPRIMGSMPFGCRVFAVKPREQYSKTTMDPRAWVGINLGRSALSPGSYKILVPATGRIVNTSDAYFEEAHFPFRPKGERHDDHLPPPPTSPPPDVDQPPGLPPSSAPPQPRFTGGSAALGGAVEADGLFGDKYEAAVRALDGHCSVLCWYVANNAFNIQFKRACEVNSSVALTSISTIFGTGVAIMYYGYTSVFKTDDKKELDTRFVISSFMFALGTLFTNISIGFLTIIHAQMLKSSEIIFAYILAVFGGKEKMRS